MTGGAAQTHHHAGVLEAPPGVAEAGPDRSDVGPGRLGAERLQPPTGPRLDVVVHEDEDVTGGCAQRRVVVGGPVEGPAVARPPRCGCAVEAVEQTERLGSCEPLSTSTSWRMSRPWWRGPSRRTPAAVGARRAAVPLHWPEPGRRGGGAASARDRSRFHCRRLATARQCPDHRPRARGVVTAPPDVAGTPPRTSATCATRRATSVVRSNRSCSQSPPSTSVIPPAASTVLRRSATGRPR